MSGILHQNKWFLIELEDECKILGHFEGVSQGVLGGESTGTGTGSVIRGKGLLDKINTVGMERNSRQSFDGIDVVDGADSSENNGRSQVIEGDGGFNGVGGFCPRMRICIDGVFDKRDMYSNW